MSIWLSVDPMADMYPHQSPYAYCSNNPISRIDPTGMLDDWFENEKTGAVFFNSEFGKEDAGSGGMTGEGWKWMGGNDMFGEVNNDFLSSNEEFYIPGDSYGKSFEVLTENGIRDGYEMNLGNNSEAFMGKMGYKQVPTQVLEYSKSETRREWTPGGNLSFDLGCTTQLTEKVGYVPKNFKLNGRHQLGQGLHSNGPGYTESVYRYRLSYGKSSTGWLSKIGNGWKAVNGGNHDYRSIGPCTPNYNLINKFKR